MFSLDAYYAPDSVGKLAVYLLRQSGHAADTSQSPGTGSDDAAMAHMEKLGALLEQYYHPSNNGA